MANYPPQNPLFLLLLVLLNDYFLSLPDPYAVGCATIIMSIIVPVSRQRDRGVELCRYSHQKLNQKIIVSWLCMCISWGSWRRWDTWGWEWYCECYFLSLYNNLCMIVCYITRPLSRKNGWHKDNMSYTSLRFSLLRVERGLMVERLHQKNNEQSFHNLTIEFLVLQAHFLFMTARKWLKRFLYLRTFSRILS
jgi:hypothetical protein